ncbi:hypothetical protein QOZ94_002812 [Xanthobacter agilis]|uniref:Uncharacterized protein n=1 Tax=Xanthobacter agilis TaxID=47492 RepID=A0ABU0LFX4_XANAG|nr:hypothetical protein [Xanthobacter agilis]
MQEMSDDSLRSIARIIGSNSAAERALAERDRRRTAGEDAVVFWDSERGVLWVGPRVEKGANDAERP